MGCAQSQKVDIPIVAISYIRGPNNTMRRVSQVLNHTNSKAKRKPQINPIPKEPNWDEKSDDEFLCMICLETKEKSLVTNCCKNIICADCSKRLGGKCPLRCKKLSTLSRTSKALNERIQKIYSLCEVCLAKVHPWDVDDHNETCLDGIIEDPSLVFCDHEWKLIRNKQNFFWVCHARTDNSEIHNDSRGKLSYECKKCHSMLCMLCRSNDEFKQLESAKGLVY
ncbi:unnamed protein product [Moneuplotes crassus]|uniref:RING-type domain-containing protein n=1 Tax=Euplotes crassus TaxID=5936 RepID=A0AAD2CWW7_EUPCR|nr:unnamed protein product [Moneuplotes crassus]